MEGTEEFEGLARAQLAAYNEIKREYENFTKYGPTRMNRPYAENKIKTINGWWANLQQNNTKLMAMATEHQDHEYFTKGYYAYVKKQCEKIIETIQQEMEDQPNNGVPFNEAEKNIAKGATGTQEGSGSTVLETSAVSTEQERRYRKQSARMNSIQRIWAAIRSTENPSEAFLRLKEKQLQDYWARFVAEDEEIESYKTTEDNDENYHGFDAFIQTEQIYEQAMENLQQQLRLQNFN